MPKSIKKDKTVTDIAPGDVSLEDSSHSLDDEEFGVSEHESVESNLSEPDLLLGIKLDSGKKELVLDHAYAEKTITDVIGEADLDVTYPVIVESGCYQLRGVCLGAEAKLNERNVIEVEASWYGSDRYRLPIASLTSGVQEMCSLNLDFPISQEARLYLTAGSGPICITGQQQITYSINEGELGNNSMEESMMDAEEGEDEEEEDNIEELPKKIVAKSTPASKTVKRKSEMADDSKKKKPKTTSKSKLESEESEDDSSASEWEDKGSDDGNAKKSTKGKPSGGKGKQLVSASGKVKDVRKKSEPGAGGKGKRQRNTSVRL